MEFEWPPVGDQIFLPCEQDFWQGAKELNSPSTIIKNLSSSFLDEFIDDWASITKPSDFSDLEVFNHVILPSEELTTDLQTTILSAEDATPVSHSSCPPSPSLSPTPGLTIKLKRVKCKWKLGSKPVVPLAASSKVWERQHASLSPGSPLHFSDDFCESPSGSTSHSITLKEVIEHHDADALLANCLNSQETFPMSTSLGDGGSLDDTFLDMRLVHDPHPFTASEDDDYTCSSGSSSHPSSFGPSPTFSVLPSDSLGVATTKGRRVRKKRCKIPPDIRYLKKKRQNKEAASRYREKKKREAESIENALHSEDLRRRKLEEDYAKVKQEFFLLKKLMREVAIAKCLVPPQAFD